MIVLQVGYSKILYVKVKNDQSNNYSNQLDHLAFVQSSLFLPQYLFLSFINEHQTV